MKLYLLILFFAFCILSCIGQQIQSPRLLPNTYRMNQNIHSVPRGGKSQQELIEKYLSMGYGGFTVNVNFHDYLTPTGMKSFKSFCDKAKSKNMELWLYDEQGYPSGNAGGRVFLENKNWEAMGIFKRDTLVHDGIVHYKLPPGRTIRTYAINKSDTINLQQYINQKTLTWDAPNGTWKIIAFSKKTLYQHFQASQNPNSPGEKLSSHYPSLMIPEVTQAFINITHEKYTKYFGSDLGKYFVSTFSDEPSLMAVTFYDDKWSVIPWASILSDTIYSRYGYFPEDRLLELFEDEGSNGQKIRYQYFHTVGELISINYFKQLKDWCARHSLKSGGHLLLEETMMAQVPLYGDIFACYRQMDAPGIDALSCIPENTPVHAPKLASSAAELTGSLRVMCEPCPVIDIRKLKGKEPTTDQVRGFFNIELAGGVTDFNNYLKLSNADIVEKREFNQYVAGIAKHLRGGHSVSDVAVFYPIESLWAAFLPEPMRVSGWDSVRGGNPKAIEIEQSFRNTARILYNDRWEYNFIDTKAIEESKVENGQLVHGDLRWKLVILPNVSTLSLLALKKLHRFVESGGFLLAIGQTLVNSTTEFPDQQIKTISKRIFRYANAKRLSSDKEVNLSKHIGKWLNKDLIIRDKELPFRFTHRIVNNKNVYFVFNDSNEIVESEVSLRDIKEPYLFNPNNGKISKMGKEILLRLDPYQGVIFTE